MSFRSGPFGLLWWYDDEPLQIEPYQRAATTTDRDREWEERLLRDLDDPELRIGPGDSVP